MARSLRRTLLTWLLLPWLAIVPAAAALQYALVLEPTRKAFDQALGDTAIAVAAFVHGEAGEAQFTMNALAERAIRTDAFDTVYYAVLGPDGQRLAGDPPLAEGALALAADAVRVYDLAVDGQPVRVVARGVACGERACQVRVGKTTSQRDQVAREALLGAVGGVAVFALASVIGLVLAAQQALKPVQRLGAQVGQRSLDDLRPLPADDAPRELHGLVDAMNRLLERVRAGSLAQQAFLADAAHQLRTPLAALKNETELALAAPHPAELQATFERLHAGTARAARLGSQLLALARSDSAARAALPSEALDLKDLAAEAADEWVPRAIAAGIDLGFELASAPVQGQRFLLRELMANLLHNALAYAGRGAQVTLRTGIDGGRALLELEDDGPGIPPEERDAVFRRFQRGSTAAGDGSGLGLAIVRDIALGHGGTVELVDGQGQGGGRGLCVRVSLPQAGR